MDKATEDLNKASHVLLDAQVKLQQVQAERLRLDKDIATLTMVEANLDENVRVLKRKRMIVMVHDFKKASTDLGTCRTRLAFLRVDRQNIIKIENHADAVYNKAKAEYEKLFELMHNPPNNVIEVDFTRRKNGQ